jgi:hypothetical protein
MAGITLEELNRQIENALTDQRPEDVFGVEENARTRYRELVRRIHPDRNPDPLATESFYRLDALWRIAKARLDAGTYGGKRVTITIKTKTRTYQTAEKVERDDVADYFSCLYSNPYGGMLSIVNPGVMKVARLPRDNDLILGEARVLSTLTEDRKAYVAFLPEVVETVGVRQSGGVVRQANVFVNPGPNWYTLAQVASRYPAGIDPRDMAWIYRRLLYVLDPVHESGFAHGALVPESVLIEPTLHGVILRNWCYSAVLGSRIPAMVRAYRDWYAPEIARKEPAGRGADIYLLARTMISLLGPSYSSVPSPIRAHFKGCTIEQRRKRPVDAYMLLKDFEQILETLYGPRRFREFSMA